LIHSHTLGFQLLTCVTELSQVVTI